MSPHYFNKCAIPKKIEKNVQKSLENGKMVLSLQQTKTNRYDNY